MIYKLLLPYSQKMYITELHKEFEGDTTFPKFDMSEWKEIERIQKCRKYRL